MEQTLTFDESTHTYRDNGVIVPSVTQILRPMSLCCYDGTPNRAMSEAAERGTLVHNAIENYVKYDGFDDCPESIHGYFDAFKDWYLYFGGEIIESECRVLNDMPKYAGTVDMVLRRGADLFIVDFKTTSQIHLPLVKAQLEAYAHAYRSPMNEKANARMVVQLKPNGKFSHQYWRESTETVKAYKAFMSCMNICGFMAQAA